MEVIGYQVLIIITICIVFYIRRKWALYAAIAWTIETLLLLYYPPLIFIQLVVVWGSYHLLTKLFSQSKEIENLKIFISSKPVEIQEIAKVVPESERQIIAGEDHRAILTESIRTANQTLCILSGWISRYVVSASFCHSISEALARGVNIYLGFGWEGMGGGHSTNESLRVALKRLEECKNKSPGNLFIGKFPTHEKIIVKDSDYVIYGSNNWLSNMKFRNLERSILLHSQELSDMESDRIAKLIMPNEI